MNYFSFNKAEDWGNGCLYSLTGTSGSLELTYGSGVNGIANEGVFYSYSTDGIDYGLQWYRAALEQDIPKDTYVKVSFYASDSQMIVFGDKAERLDEVILSDMIPEKEKRRILDPLYTESFTNASDVLINSKGKFLWIRVELRGAAGNSPKLKRLRVYMPGENIIDYLPEIYRIRDGNSDFFFRFMLLFQTFIFDQEDKINNISRYFDIGTAERDFLEWLCKWLDIRDIYSWEESRLRMFLSEAMKVYAAAGTRQGIERLVELFTGEKPYLIEYSQVKSVVESGIQDNPYKRIFGDNPYRFFVLISEAALTGTKKYEALVKLLKENIPAQTEAVVVPLKPYIYLDMHTYIGVNSSIGEQTALILEKNMSIPFNTLLSDI